MLLQNVINSYVFNQTVFVYIFETLCSVTFINERHKKITMIGGNKD